MATRSLTVGNVALISMVAATGLDQVQSLKI
jgi:hypothetical protein